MSEVKLEKRKVPDFKDKEPDIAFWFDEDDETLYLVKVRDSLHFYQLALACMDLMARANKWNKGLDVCKFTEER